MGVFVDDIFYCRGTDLAEVIRSREHQAVLLGAVVPLGFVIRAFESTDRVPVLRLAEEFLGEFLRVAEQRVHLVFRHVLGPHLGAPLLHGNRVFLELLFRPRCRQGCTRCDKVLPLEFRRVQQCGHIGFVRLDNRIGGLIDSRAGVVLVGEAGEVVPELVDSLYSFSGVCEANVLIFPDLNAANTSYKLMQRIGGAEAIGPVLMGMAHAAHILLPSDDVRDIVNMARFLKKDVKDYLPDAAEAEIAKARQELAIAFAYLDKAGQFTGREIESTVGNTMSDAIAGSVIRNIKSQNETSKEKEA